MPYIAQEDRKELDGAIDALASAIVERAKKQSTDVAFAGLLNYSLTRLALEVVRLQHGKMRYWIVALLSGVFHNVADEFYRRVGIPYEDKQIKKSGDVDLYREYAKEIERL